MDITTSVRTSNREDGRALYAHADGWSRLDIRLLGEMNVGRIALFAMFQPDDVCARMSAWNELEH